MVVAGQMLVNDLMTMLFISGFLTSAPSRNLPAREHRRTALHCDSRL